jgi:hypothetical protein
MRKFREAQQRHPTDPCSAAQGRLMPGGWVLAEDVKLQPEPVVSRNTAYRLK